MCDGATGRTKVSVIHFLKCIHRIECSAKRIARYCCQIKYAEKIIRMEIFVKFLRMEIFVKFLSQKKKPPRLSREIDSRVEAAGLKEVSRNFWNFFLFFKKKEISRTLVLFVEALISLFWTSGHVCFAFQSPSRPRSIVCIQG